MNPAAYKILSTYCIICIVGQVCLALFWGWLAGWKHYYKGYERRCDDGEGIAVLMLCTFLLLLAPITVWFILVAIIYEFKQIKQNSMKRSM